MALLAKVNTKQALSMLVDVVSKNDVLLMNLPMSPRGTHDSLAIETLKEIDDWMAINGKAIFESTTWKTFGNGKIHYTRKER